MRRILVSVFLIVSFISSFAFDNELSAIVKRPNSNELYVGGMFTTIFVIDDSTGVNIRTIEIEQGIEDLQFSPDAQILIGSTKSKVLFIDPITGKTIKSIDGDNFQLFNNAPYFVDSKWYGDAKAIVYDSQTGEIYKEIPLAFKPLACGFNEDFSQLIIASRRIDISASDEKKYLSSKIQILESYNVYNSAYTSKQEDSKGSTILVYDFTKDQAISTFTCPFDFTASFGIMIFKNQEQIFISDWDMLLSIDKKGICTAIECDDATFAYSLYLTDDRNFICISSTKDGMIYNIEKNSFTNFDLKENYEFSYTADITSAENALYLLAKDFTINIMDLQGVKTNTFKIVYNNDKGFGVYYYNGYSKKEDRDKEAAIINAVLGEYKMNIIDLETGIGKSDFIIGTFPTVEEAEKFVDALKSKSLQYILEIAPIR